MKSSPETHPPLSGAAAAIPADATGAGTAEVTPAAGTHASQPDADALARAFLGEAHGNPDAATATPPEGQEPDAGSAEAADDAGESPEPETAEHSAPEKGKLDHLLDAFAKDPDNEGIRKRLNKILGESPRLKQALADAEKKLKDSSGPPVVVAPAHAADPLAGVGSMAELQTAVRNAEQWEAWCEDHPEGGNLNPKDDSSYLSPEDVRAQLRAARTLLRAAPARTDWLKQLEANREKLRADVPELFEADSPLLNQAVALLKEGRVTAAHPDYMQDALDLLEGRRARQEREKGIKTVKLAPAAAKQAAGNTGSPASHRPAPQTGAVTKAPATRPASAGADIAALRKRAEAGDQKASDDLARAFMDAAA